MNIKFELSSTIPKSKPLDLKYRKRVLIISSYLLLRNCLLMMVTVILLILCNDSPDKIIEVINRGVFIWLLFVPITKFLDQKKLLHF